ncbi:MULTISPECIES: helix-turn-helix transcriptional regulator [Streptomyces]|uniref:helix-turn-helix transcriptional regulator n=1 Tax=Streptomyces TaxID=1883 RepID=UPI0022499CD3|nr:AAA family ATPase [Streptomyces sp. JHD 1]MCX2968745.1 AAA family ATPase [Streptomyces sp. JHD 1]
MGTTRTGRAAAAHAVDTALARCLAGGSGVLLVEGATGSGRSTLLDAVAERAAAAGATVRTAVATPAERHRPLGVLRQLTHALPDAAPALAPPAGPPAPPGPAADLAALGAWLHAGGAGRPVVWCADDLEHADAESLHALCHLARHARTAPLLLVLSAPPPGHRLEPGTRGDLAHVAELARRPHFRRVRLAPLTPAETAAALADPEGALADPDGPAVPAPADTAALHRLSGGSPLLLRALAEERRLGLGPAAEEADPDGPFAQAVAACLRRAGAPARAVARAVAVLGAPGTDPRVTARLGVDAATTARALTALTDAGVLAGAAFRHPAARAAVLRDTGADVRALLHRQAARTLLADGAPAADAAAHLLAAPAGPAAGADPAADPADAAAAAADAEVLYDAAEALLGRGEPGPARELLARAGAAAGGDAHAALALRGAALATRCDPAAADRRLDALCRAARAGRVPAGQRTPLAALLLAHGRVPDAVEVTAPAAPPASGDAVHPDPSAALDPLLDTDPEAAERLLDSTALTDATLAPLAQAVRGLTGSGCPDRAVPWSRHLRDEADRAHAPGWSALFGTLHAEALLRLGDPRGAHEQATAALAALPAPPEGTGAPDGLRCAATAALVHACADLGRYAEAAALAARPVRRLPPGLPALAYLRARGLHHLALHQPRSALADFTEAGRLMAEWGVDRPAYLPWRTDAAEALLRLGERRQAAHLAARQLDLPDGRRPWARGQALRVRALAGDARQRTATLHQAVDALHRSGDRVAAARAMADLGRALQADGAAAKGGAMVRTAWNLARDAGASALCREILPAAPLTAPRTAAPRTAAPRTAAPPHPAPRTAPTPCTAPDATRTAPGGAPGALAGGTPAARTAPDGARPARGTAPATTQPAGPAEPAGPATTDTARSAPAPGPKLSTSEQRVATLAAQGLTNREISAKLFLTVSTVEQHLTRVYRKLRISRRGDLPLDLRQPHRTPT